MEYTMNELNNIPFVEVICALIELQPYMEVNSKEIGMERRLYVLFGERYFFTAERGVMNGNGVVKIYRDDLHLITCTYENGKAVAAFPVVYDMDNQIFDFADGCRCEGRKLSDGLFYGSFYNPDNQLYFYGHQKNQSPVGFGIEFLLGSDELVYQYYGFYKGGKRHGIGCDYTQTGVLFRSGFWSSGEYISVSPVVQIEDDLEKLCVLTEDITITLKQYYKKDLVLTDLKSCKSIHFDNAIHNDSQLTIRNLDHLTALVFEGKCFDGAYDSQEKGLTLYYCECLKSVRIDDTCFFSASVFSIKNCDALESILIGENKADAMGCFNKVSVFAMQDLLQLKSIRIGENCMYNAKCFIWENLPSLSEFIVYSNGCRGKEASVVLLNLPHLPIIQAYQNAFSDCRYIYYNYVKLPKETLSTNILFTGARHLFSLQDQPRSDVNDTASEHAHASNFVEHYEHLETTQPLVAVYPVLKVIHALSTSIILPSMSCNDTQTFDLQELPHLKHFGVKDHCFSCVQAFEMKNHEAIERLTMGDSCCSQTLRNVDPFVGSFTLYNLSSLGEIVIGNNCFRKFKSFTLQNLPLLTSICIGNSKAAENEECFSSVEELQFEDLPSLTSISLGNNVFSKASLVCFANLPHVITITIGDHSILGDPDYEGQLRMENLPFLVSFKAGKYCCFYCSLLVLDNTPRLKKCGILSKKENLQFLNSIYLHQVSDDLKTYVEDHKKNAIVTVID